MFIKLENYFCLKSHPHGQKITDMVFLEQNLFFFFEMKCCFLGVNLSVRWPRRPPGQIKIDSNGMMVL
jgi:hypothetical protein